VVLQISSIYVLLPLLSFLPLSMPLPCSVPRFSTFSAFNVFIVGALLRLVLDFVIAAGAVDSRRIKVLSTASSSSFFSSSSPGRARKDRWLAVTAAKLALWEGGGGGGEKGRDRDINFIKGIVLKLVKRVSASAVY
jgi:hypothetical protein